jgi:hypothetical protein
MTRFITLAHLATSPEVTRAAKLVQARIGESNVAVWAACAHMHMGAASHILLMGVRGTPSPVAPVSGRLDNPWRYLWEAVGGRRQSPLPITNDDALAVVTSLKQVATVRYPAPDLLAIAGWSGLHAAVMKHRGTGAGWETRAVLDAVTRRAARTYRLQDARRAFLNDHTKLRVVA